jgi:hypothetical protein
MTIFYPHRWTLGYSEANLGAGLLAIPVCWAKLPASCEPQVTPAS